MRKTFAKKKQFKDFFMCKNYIIIIIIIKDNDCMSCVVRTESSQECQQTRSM